jgi:hypothetical protein
MRFVPFIAVIAMATASPAIAADRLTDRDLKELVSRIEQGRDRFDDALDGRLKRSIVRGPSGEANVGDFLNDFQENIDRLEERLKPEYAASAEAGTLLRQATAIDRFFRSQPPGTKGESEWNRLAADLKSLGAAYGADFPLPENAVVRRLGDGEVAAALDEIARSAGALKKSLDRELKQDKSLDKPTREAAVREADQLSKDAKAVRSRVNDGKPSSAEADRLLERAARLQSFIQAHQVPTSASAWPGIRSRLEAIAGAYGRRWPAET